MSFRAERREPRVVQQTFENIYHRGVWAGGCGPGSDAAATKGYRQLLERFIRANAVSSVVDLGCGDGRLARLIDWGECSYLGLDIVRPVIERNQRLYASESIQFVHADIREYPLPPAVNLTSRSPARCG